MLEDLENHEILFTTVAETGDVLLRADVCTRKLGNVVLVDAFNDPVSEEFQLTKHYAQWFDKEDVASTLGTIIARDVPCIVHGVVVSRPKTAIKRRRVGDDGASSHHAKKSAHVFTRVFKVRRIDAFSNTLQGADIHPETFDDLISNIKRVFHVTVGDGIGEVTLSSGHTRLDAEYYDQIVRDDTLSASLTLTLNTSRDDGGVQHSEDETAAAPPKSIISKGDGKAAKKQVQFDLGNGAWSFDMSKAGSFDPYKGGGIDFASCVGCGRDSSSRRCIDCEMYDDDEVVDSAESEHLAMGDCEYCGAHKSACECEEGAK